MAGKPKAGKPRVGVLALQGDFAAHAQSLQQAGAEAVEVRTRESLASVDALVMPGGESTTMLKLMSYENLWEPLQEFGASKPIFGTCAGAILLAKHVTSPSQISLALMDLDVERNAYGRQLDSHIAQVDLEGAPLEAVFIRAPIIRRVGPAGKVWATHRGDPVLVTEGKHMVATFHPELTCDPRVHAIFLRQL
ncbi:MAG: pyridoxal 5'-phosphate synthase glutaminase subunit PdxT [Bryobacteraceae bacterium]|nr:pyridoxal 5'-phosphate synthase glutaminase subunit PdxT [Bryobacteraceae bacterium]